ncbi:putative spermatogenesis-associated protein 7-like [Apostichopus japonicus]|uniref:Putative spermatogenesis-associated protein 7-like n=1 Tax=Stichopus japonicus TaxID=307972 RepID=A0A2G8L006_STIJA|nr:putative spermatogenesis-associated protein 7-like [Apostichopus japonicus]
MTSSQKKHGKSSPYSANMGHMKGHVSVKSNAFSPTCKRLSSQDMVLDNMVAHSRKMHSVKSRIDNSVPKTWTSSTVKRDQLRRQVMQKGGKPSRPSSAPMRANHLGYSASAPTSPAKMDRYLDGDLSVEDFDMHLDINGDDIHYQTARSSPAYPRHRSGQNNISNGGRNSSQMLLRSRVSQSHDLLDTMATRFTDSGKSHTPRFLKTAATSRLAQSKYYNPPKRRRGSRSLRGQRRS